MATRAVREGSNNGGSLSGSLTQRSPCISIWKSFTLKETLALTSNENTVAKELYTWYMYTSTKAHPVTSTGTRTSWSPPARWNCPPSAPPTWMDLLQSLCSGSSRYTPSTRSSAGAASNTTVSSTVMSLFIYYELICLFISSEILINALWLYYVLFLFLWMLYFINCLQFLNALMYNGVKTHLFVFIKLSMLRPMFTRGRVRRSTWRASHVVWTASCYRYARLTVHSVRCGASCVFLFTLCCFLHIPCALSCRKGLKSLWIRICYDHRGPGGAGGSSVPPAPAVLDRPSLLRKANRATATTKPPPPQVGVWSHRKLVWSCFWKRHLLCLL